MLFGNLRSSFFLISQVILLLSLLVYKLNLQYNQQKKQMPKFILLVLNLIQLLLKLFELKLICMLTHLYGKLGSFLKVKMLGQVTIMIFPPHYQQEEDKHLLNHLIEAELISLSHSSVSQHLNKNEFLLIKEMKIFSEIYTEIVKEIKQLQL